MGLVSEMKPWVIWPAKIAKPSTDKVYCTRKSIKKNDDA